MRFCLVLIIYRKCFFAYVRLFAFSLHKVTGEMREEYACKSRHAEEVKESKAFWAPFGII